MSHPSFDDLFDLAHGVGTPRTRAHVETCAACRAEIAGQRQVLADVQDAHRHDRPDPFTVARHKRALMGRIGEAARPRRRLNLQAAAALAIAACSGAAMAYGVIRYADRAPAVDPVVLGAPVPAAPAAPVAVVVDEPAPEAVEPAPVVEAAPAPVVTKRPAPKKRPKLARIEQKPSAKKVAARLLAEAADVPSGRTAHFDAGEVAALAGDADGATRSFVRALGSKKGGAARERLEIMAGDGSTSRAVVLGLIRDDDVARNSKDGLKLLCQWSLAERSDREAVMFCKAVAERFGQDPDVRRLALAAGRVAEHDLEDMDLARRLYTRAILVSQYAGLASTEALLARARVLARMGERDAAAADLRLYIHRHPEATYQDDVAELMRSLGVTAQKP